MASGSYKGNIQCPCCDGDLTVLVEWYSTPGSYYEPPDGETNVFLVFPEKEDRLEFEFCPHTGHKYTDEDIDMIWRLAENLPDSERTESTDGDDAHYDEEPSDPETETNHMRSDQ